MLPYESTCSCTSVNITNFKRKEKEKENNDLANLPSHDNQGLPNRLQDLIADWEQGKPISFHAIYQLAITFNNRY